MLRVGLTGGIGSGKSVVSALLVERGAVLVDADVNARAVVAKGTPGLAAVVREFGDGVLRPDGELDRPALGAIVFADPEKLARLNAIVHPLVGAESAGQIAAAEDSGVAVLVHDIPLLVENGLQGWYDAVIVVAASPRTQLDRLTRLRGMAAADAQARIDAQAPLADKLAAATYVITNDGPIEDLVAQVDRVWSALLTLPEARKG
jgi:dephospho-CoA kinase